jgi:hypothetical protein
MTENKRHIFTWLGLVLVMPFAGAYLLNAVFFPPPPRPPAVPEEALPFIQQYGPDVWWWGDCRELPQPRLQYDCRLFDGEGAVVVAGRFAAQARTYSDDDGVERPGRLPRRGQQLRYGRPAYHDDNGEIGLLSPLGCWLVPQEWLLLPSRKSKAPVTIDDGRTSLGPEQPMTDQEVERALIPVPVDAATSPAEN